MKKGFKLCIGLMSLAILAGCASKRENVEQATVANESISAVSEETTSILEEVTTVVETETTTEATEQVALENGVYEAEFHTDSSMFHVNEACNGIGKLTVEDGVMTIHVSLASTSILQLFPGMAEDAQKEGAVLLNPTTDKVTYSDGLTEEVYGFDVPVPYLDREFDLALIGKKGKWYDHKVYVTNPVKVE